MERRVAHRPVVARAAGRAAVPAGCGVVAARRRVRAVRVRGAVRHEQRHPDDTPRHAAAGAVRTAWLRDTAGLARVAGAAGASDRADLGGATGGCAAGIACAAAGGWGGGVGRAVAVAAEGA